MSQVGITVILGHQHASSAVILSTRPGSIVQQRESICSTDNHSVAPNCTGSLYRTTRCDALWKAEKRWYAKASPLAQRLARAGYIAAYGTAYTLAGRGSFRKFLANYKSARGMDFYHDVHDWRGGYPYETALAPEVDSKLTNLGFRAERIFARPTMTHGLLGSGCDEYVYRACP